MRYKLGRSHSNEVKKFRSFFTSTRPADELTGGTSASSNDLDFLPGLEVGDERLELRMDGRLVLFSETRLHVDHVLQELGVEGKGDGDLE